MNNFKLKSHYKPTGDQPEAIYNLVKSIQSKTMNQVLMGVTGSGKTFTMANVIERVQKPTLIISHNKTLAAQLYQEFRDYFPDNAVSYFVSYYDYYQPEAYIPQSDTYIEKETDINDQIDKLRLAATTNLLTRKDVIVIASVSCIYNLGSPIEYAKSILELKTNENMDRKKLLLRLNDLQYSRNDMAFIRGTYRVRGDLLDIYPAYQDTGYRIQASGDEITKISSINPITGEVIAETNKIIIYAAKHFQADKNSFKDSFEKIRNDLDIQIDLLKSQNKILEAHRIQQRVTYDLEMIQELGYVNGIENYSRYFDGRKPGDAPFSLLDYFPKDYLTIIDESHITVPQIRGMYNGDRARKQTLIDFGFRLPSSLDNHPLRFEEFQRRLNQTIYVSATPNEWEISMSENKVIEQLVRPTGLIDPLVEIHPTKGQIQDLIVKIIDRTSKHQRVLVTTMTKRMAEDLANYLDEQKIKVHYLHSDLDTLERLDILDDLRAGKYDVIVGINLLREGLDLPEVSLVAILDADKEGFLRSRTSLIQTMGRAARHDNGAVIMYADKVTDSMKNAIDEVQRRRDFQMKYNRENNITPQSISKPIREKMVEHVEEQVIALDPKQILKSRNILDASDVDMTKVNQLVPEDRMKLIGLMTRQMNSAAKSLEFELAAKIRDRIKEISLYSS
ncbi:excinuclease ABC subunit UvrB [Candidatus Amesbacteria bacterium]|nr:excinuclease ABC subunit UvrB [Candidatus Amesbacteria bacterium]